MSPFRPLTRLYLDRYRASEALASDSGFEANVYALIGLIVAGEMFLSSFGPLFLVAYAFGVTGFATAFEWDMLFPDRRDFLVLTPFPIHTRHLFAAKLASLGIFLSTIVVAVHSYIPFYIVQVETSPRAVALPEAVRAVVGEIAATAAASLFGFLAVAGFQGTWANLCGPRSYRRLSPWLQTVPMCVMIFSVLLFPLYRAAVVWFPAGQATWLWWLPPSWFWGISEFLAAQPRPAVVALGVFGCKILAVSLLVFAAAWAAGFARQYRATLEAEDTVARRPARRRPMMAELLGSNEARAIYDFTGQTLARSVKHRLFLATYLAVGVSLGALVSLSVTRGHLGLSPLGLRSLPALMAFFVVSGFRAAFQFPAELPANWLFRLTESGWGEAARRAARLRVTVSGLLPVLALFVPLEIVRWGWRAGIMHTAIQAAAGMLLIEVLFYSFDKIPFTCSYYPGGLNLIFLAAAYLYGFTNYSFQIADLEAWLENRAGSAALCLAAAGTMWFAIRRFRRRGAIAIRFEGGEPAIQTLDLN
jgi:hypothetical protein